MARLATNQELRDAENDGSFDSLFTPSARAMWDAVEALNSTPELLPAEPTKRRPPSKECRPQAT
jgi:hypothetical protein